MPSSANYLGSWVGARIEPNRVDNSNKTKLNETPKTDKFTKVLEQEKAKGANQAQNNISRLGDKSSVSTAMSKKVNAKYSNEAADLKQRIEAGMQAREKDDGTDFALKELACQFEQQILGILWNLAFSSMDREFEGGLGEELFHKELVNEMVKLADTGEMGEIAQSIYNDLKNQSENDNKKTEIEKKSK